MRKIGLTALFLAIGLFAVMATFFPRASAQEREAAKPDTSREEIEGWVKALSSPDRQKKYEAIEALGKLGEKALPAVPALIRLLDGPSAETDSMLRAQRLTPQWAAARALISIGLAALPALTAALKDPSADLRLNVLYVLKYLPINRTAEALILAAKDTSQTIRIHALWALSLSNEKRTIDIRLAALNDSTFEIRQAAVGSLRAPVAHRYQQEVLPYADDDRTRIAQTLIPLLSETYLRPTVISTLGTLGVAVAADPILPFLNDPDQSVRFRSIDALETLQHRRAIPALVGLLSHKDQTTALSAAKALGRLGDRRAVAPIAALLKSKDESRRKAAAHLLGTMKDRSVVPALIAALEDKDDYVRKSAAEALGALGDRRAAPALRRLLETLQPGSAEAAGALAKLNDARAVPALVKAVFEGEYLPGQVMEAAGYALEHIKSEETIPLLAETLLRKPHNRPGAIALFVLAQLTGVEEMTVNRDVFVAWWEKNKSHYKLPPRKP